MLVLEDELRAVAVLAGVGPFVLATVVFPMVLAEAVEGFTRFTADFIAFFVWGGLPIPAVRSMYD